MTTSSETADRVVVSACHGEQYWLVAEPWAKHIAAVDGCRVELVSLDGGSTDGVSTFIMDASSVKLQWAVGERFQIERIIWHLGQGRIGMHVDLDVRLKREFSEPLSSLPYDMIISRAYGSPLFAVEKLGFVACLGFWIAKPRAKGLCELWLRNILEKTYGTAMDQDVFNFMLCAAPPPRQETVRLGELSLDMDVFELEGCKIGVLPKEAVERNLDRTSIFGNHARPIYDTYLWQALRKHPVKAAKHLLLARLRHSRDRYP
jgi:hypothetical protein